MKRLSLLVLFIFLLGSVFFFDLTTYLTLEQLKISQAYLENLYRLQPIIFTLEFIGLYVFLTALSIPGSLIMTLTAGMLFGPLFGALAAVFSATIGATFAFLSSRFIFRDMLEKKYHMLLDKFNKGLLESPKSYVVFIRLVPLFPFFIVNLVFGLTRVSFLPYFWGTFIGMLPASLVYANAGSQLGTIETLSDIVSLNVMVAFALLALLALIPTYFSRKRQLRHCVDKRGLVILMAHGSRDPKWIHKCEEIVSKISASSARKMVSLCYMEIASPTLSETIEGLNLEDIDSISVIPLFIASGGHVSNDIPHICEEAFSRYPHVTYQICAPLGENELSIKAYADIIDAI